MGSHYEEVHDFISVICFGARTDGTRHSRADAGMAEWLKWIDDAVKLLKDHPHFKTPGRASIEVLEFVPMPGT